MSLYVFVFVCVCVCVCGTPTEDKASLQSVSLLRVACGHRHTVEQAKAHGPRGQHVVTWGPHEREAWGVLS